ncbi:MAG: hypothetical protein QUS14_13880 [Pyrinomonadaceae bacterium]|nr:hypothetical protein [Pyrinomonadaceae bacterium]
MIRIEDETDDDLDFITIVEAFVNRLIDTLSPTELYLVKIDHWFDFKWRGFQGKLLGSLGIRNFEKLRVPPFIPDRVVRQLHFKKVHDEWSAQSAGLHFYRSSSANVTSNYLVAVSEPRLFVWYSGGTNSSERGSLMAYVIEPSNTRSFYLSLSKDGEWKTLKTDGISKSEARFLLATLGTN